MSISETRPAPEIHPEDPDDEWRVDDSGRFVRLRYLTAGLVVLGLLGGGFWGGVLAEKHHGNGSSNNSLSALASRFASARSGAGGITGTGGGATAGTGGAGGSGGAGFFGSATNGTVIGIQGDVLDLSDQNGSIVKVTVGPSTAVTRTSRSPLSGLQVGDTVVVVGSTSDPTAIRATAQGSGTQGTGSQGTGASGGTGIGSFGGSGG